MNKPSWSAVDCLRTLIANAKLESLRDSELLRLFIDFGQGDAFASLLRRHGPMVLALARRIVGDHHIAEDVCQATFLILSRKARAIRGRDSLPAWLHNVAFRLAVRANKSRRRSQEVEHAAPIASGRDPLDDLTAREFLTIVDEELNNLPEKLRLPLILCQLEGLSREKAAQRLHWSPDSVKTRLEQGRERLRLRLARRGLISGAAIASSLHLGESALALPPALVQSTVRAALTGEAASSGAIALVNGAIKMMSFAKLQKVCLAATLIGTMGWGAGWLVQGGWSGEQEKTPKPVPNSLASQEAKHARDVAVASDQHGDPLPQGAIARLGTMRFRGTSSAFALSHDGKILAAANGYGVDLWDASSGLLLRRLPFPESCQSLAVSADGKIFVAGGRIPCLIDMETGKKLGEFELPTGPERWCLALSPDGRTLAAGSGAENRLVMSTTVFLFDVPSGQEKRRLKLDFDKTGVYVGAHKLAFSPDGKLLASASDDKAVHIWDVTTGKEFQPLRHEQSVLNVAFSPTGRLLASCDEGEVRLWDLETARSSHTLKIESNWSPPLAFSPDGKLIAYPLRRGTVCLWNVEAAKEVFQVAASTMVVASLAFSIDGKVLISGGQSCPIRRWNIATGTEIDPDGGHIGAVVSLMFAEGRKSLFSGGTDLKLFEWDLTSGRQRRQLFAKLPGSPGVRWPNTNYALAPDGRTLAWTGILEPEQPSDHLIHLWDCSTGKEIRSLDGQADFIWPLLFSPDGKVLASGSPAGPEGKVSASTGTRLWDLATGKELHFLQRVRGFAFSPDGKLLAGTKNNFRTISLWQVATGKELREWDSPLNGSDLVFSPNGKLLASSHDRLSETGRFVVCIWETGTGNQVACFEQQALVHYLAFSPSGRTLAGAFGNRERYFKGQSRGAFSICLWDVLSGQEIRQIQSPIVPWSLAFAPDSRTLAAGNADSTVLVWDLTGRAGDEKLGINKPASAALSAKEMEGLWSDLGSDARRAQDAIWTLAFAPRQSIPLLKEHMLFTPVPEDKLAKLVADLDRSSFAVRQQAAQALENWGEAAEHGVRKLLNGNPTLEVQQRLSRFLERREKETLRKMRAIEVLEQIGTPEARHVLEFLAVGAANPLAREAAESALKRLASRAR